MNSIGIRMDRKGDLFWTISGDQVYIIFIYVILFLPEINMSGHEYIFLLEFFTYYIELQICVFPRNNRRTDARISVIGFWFNCSRETFRSRYIQTEHPSSNVISKQSVLHSHHRTSRLLFQYVSLLRPPVTESSAPGAELIDKLEWKQVRILRTHASSPLNYLWLITRDILIIYCNHLLINDKHNTPVLKFVRPCIVV